MASEEEYGYDEEFVDGPPEYLKCVICHLVLRDPLQLIECGHHYCAACFRRIKEYSSHFNSPLSCPIDRQVIDLTKVSKDKFVERLVLDLKVKCSFKDDGCTWEGELRNAEAHRSECPHAVKEVGSKEVELLKKKVLDNEEIQKLQSKDIETLKNENGELKQKMLQCENEILSHKGEINDVRVLVEVLKEEIKELKTRAEEEQQNECSSGGAKATQSLTTTQTDAPHHKQNTFVWKCNVKEWKISQYTYSPPFHCHPGGIPCKLDLYLCPDKRIHLYFEPEDVAHQGDVTFNVDVEFVKDDVNNYARKKVVSTQFTWKGDSYKFLCTISKSDYKAFIVNNILTISRTWTCQH